MKKFLAICMMSILIAGGVSTMKAAMHDSSTTDIVPIGGTEKIISDSKACVQILNQYDVDVVFVITNIATNERLESEPIRPGETWHAELGREIIYKADHVKFAVEIQGQEKDWFTMFVGESSSCRCWLDMMEGKGWQFGMVNKHIDRFVYYDWDTMISCNAQWARNADKIMSIPVVDKDNYMARSHDNTIYLRYNPGKPSAQ